MRQPRILGVSAGADDFRSLIEAARKAGVRIGWLDLEAEGGAPTRLVAPAAAGALRAVGVSERTVVAVKQLRGEPVLRDLLREHFTGCVLVLVKGAVKAPVVEPAGTDWRVSRSADDPGLLLTTAELLDSLRKPHFP